MTLDNLKSLLVNQDVRVEAYVSFNTQEEMIAWKHEWESNGGIILSQLSDSMYRVTLKVTSCVEL